MCFDAHLICATPQDFGGGIAGAIFFGPCALESKQHCRAQAPSGVWLCALPLAHLVGATDPRFPQDADVLNLAFSTADLQRHVKEPPHAWFPLLETSRARRVWFKFSLGPKGAEVTGLRRLARQFPHAQLIVDPFLHGPKSAWQALVRLAEFDNIWLTTRGMLPSTNGKWTALEDLNAAMHFTIGEVGAGKLLLASGCDTAMSASEMRQWLRSIHTLNDAERELIEGLNARELFSA
jgi:hypothetical protein